MLKIRRQEQEEQEEDDGDSSNDSKDPVPLLLEPRHARHRRKRIIKAIKELDEKPSTDPNESSTDPREPSIDPAYSNFHLPRAVAQLSNPKIVHKLLFPFVRVGVPNRFTLDKKDRWRYVGREKFAELLRELRLVRRETKYKRLFVYGTRGYGKSHLLAALVCYLTALGKRVIYIPDCRSCLEGPVDCFRTAMLFAWADDKATQNDILKLDSKKMIERFLEPQGNILYVIDQLNALSTKKGAKLSEWINALISSRKAVLSSSANYQGHLRQQISQKYVRVMRLYGGFTTVCLNIG